MATLFDRIPSDLFSPLSRKYKSIYAFALVCLYRCLKLYKTDIKRSDYVSVLRSQGTQIMALFSVEQDRLDDKEDEVSIDVDSDGDNLNSKINYIVRKLSGCGWFIVSKNPKNGIEYIYVPSYSIQLLKVIDELTSDVGSYLPLVHQTYAELKMEDEKEDDYMYRALLNARQNADEIEMSVTLLRQQICVFGNRLTSVLDPNIALSQHFDEYRTSVSDKYYHPMKTFDSLGLYSQPTIAILNKWLKSERTITLMVKEAKSEPANRGKGEDVLAREIIKTINEIIDIFSKLTSAFNDIDSANADYTEAVQKKINYLSATDKTVKGKIDRIILALATEIKENPALRYDELPILERATDTLSFDRAGFLDSRSMTMPFRREQAEESEPLPMDDDFFPLDQAELMRSMLDSELDRFSDDAVEAFIGDAMGKNDRITTEDITVRDADSLVLMILAILKAMLNVIPYKVTKISDRIEHDGYYMPSYSFERKGTKRKSEVR